MKSIILGGLLALAACAPSAPLGNNTVVHEQVGLGVELAYQAAGNAVLVGLRSGVIPASAKPCINALDRRAFAAVSTVRVAYDAGNAATIDPRALASAKAAVNDFLTQKGC